MNFKHGDRVTCKIDGTKITDVKISINSDGTPFICQNECNGSNASDKLGYKYSWQLSRDFTSYNVTDLKLASPCTLDDLQKGDVVMFDEDGNGRTVLTRMDDCVFLSDFGRTKYPWDWYTIQQLKDRGYTLKAEPVEEEPKYKLYQQYWKINSQGMIHQFTYGNTTKQRNQANFMGFYNTKEEAETARTEIAKSLGHKVEVIK